MLDHLYAKFDKAHFAGLCKAIADGMLINNFHMIIEIVLFKLECGRHGDEVVSKLDCQSDFSREIRLECLRLEIRFLWFKAWGWIHEALVS